MNGHLTFPNDFYRSEKYTDVLWITAPNGEGHEVWIEVEDRAWLSIQILPENYPSVGVSVVEQNSREELAAMIHHNCKGWSAAKGGGVLEDLLRLDADGTILSIEQVAKEDAAYAKKLKKWYKQNETRSCKRLEELLNIPKRKK